MTIIALVIQDNERILLTREWKTPPHPQTVELVCFQIEWQCVIFPYEDVKWFRTNHGRRIRTALKSHRKMIGCAIEKK